MLSLTAMMDAAAIDLSVRRSPPPEARLFLWSGVSCVNDLAITLHTSQSPASQTEPMISRDDFTAAMTALAESGFPCEIPVDEAWSSFVAWRQTYATTASGILDAIVAPEAPWTGDRTLPVRTNSHHTANTLQPQDPSTPETRPSQDPPRSGADMTPPSEGG
jgi:hypothetical protein